ncbi:MAG: hypothetical protein GY765_26700, partial [bacterium]|nr:hypothetical protein [bacterium]
GLPEYMIPAQYIQLEHMPLTPAGKINRKILERQGGEALGSGALYVAPTTETEKKLACIWSELLDKERIGLTDNFFDLGGHSLKAVTLLSRVHKELSVKIPLMELFKTPTIRGMAEYIGGDSGEASYTAVEAVEKREYYPLSVGQQRFHILQQMDPQGTAYNITQIIPLSPALPAEGLENAFRGLIKRHEGLRTSFPMVAGGQSPEAEQGVLVQRVHEDAQFELENLRAERPGDFATLIRSFIRPFDLSKAPLVRAALMEDGERRVLATDVHHIVSDGTSQQVLVADFIALLSGAELPELPLQYKDFCHWQDRMIRDGGMKVHEEFWLDHLQAPLAETTLPTDFPRSKEQSFAGALYKRTLDRALSDALYALALQRNCTLYMLLLAVYNVLLSRYTGMEDIVVGSPMAGRDHADLEKIIGLIMQSIMVRNFPKGEKPFAEFLGEVRERTLEAYEHQAYPYEELIKKVESKDSSWNAVTGVALIVQNMVPQPGGEGQAPQQSTGNNEESPVDAVPTTSKLDLTITAWERQGDILLDFEYCTALFKPGTIEGLADHFINILKEVVAEPEIPISFIDMPGDEEKTGLMQSAQRCYPLTHAQKRIYYTEILNPGTPANTLAFTIRYDRELDKGILETAIEKVLFKNEGLRLRIVKFDFYNEAYQYIAPHGPYPLETFQFNDAPEQGEQRLRKWLENDMKKPFVFVDTPLYYFAHFVVNESESLVYLKLHHFISDGWTMFLLSNEITELYEALEKGGTVDEVPNTSYIQYLRDEKAYLNSDKRVEDGRFWHHTLQPLPEEQQLSLNPQREAVDSIVGGVEKVLIPDDLRGQLHAYCKCAGTSLFKLFLAALAVYLSRASGTNEAVIAGSGHNRGTKIHRGIIGMFASTFLLRIPAEPDGTFASLVDTCGKNSNSILKNRQQYPFDLLSAEIRDITNVDCNYLLDINLVGHPDVPEEKFRMEHLFPGDEPTPLTIHINASNRDIHGELELEWNYRVQLFNSDDIRRIHGHLVTILQEAMAHPETPLNRIGIATQSEKEAILRDFNNTAAEGGYA